MAIKRAKFFSYGDDAMCVEIKEFIEKAGVILEVRDIEKNPLSVDELSGLFGHINIRHFLNTISDSYSKLHLDTDLPPREKILELMAQDHTLIRRPVIKTVRLLTVGCDRRKLVEMLQITMHGNEPQNDSTLEGNRRFRNDRNDRGGRNDRERTAVSGK